MLLDHSLPKGRSLRENGWQISTTEGASHRPVDKNKGRGGGSIDPVDLNGESRTPLATCRLVLRSLDIFPERNEVKIL